LAKVVKKLNNQVKELQEKEEKMIGVLVAVKKQGIDLERIINQGIYVEEEEEEELEQILTGKT
jgi:hypothetical protein